MTYWNNLKVLYKIILLFKGLSVDEIKNEIKNCLYLMPNS